MGLPSLNLYPTKVKMVPRTSLESRLEQLYINIWIKTTEMSCAVIINSIMILSLPRSLWKQGSRDTQFSDLLFLLADLKISSNYK